MLFEIKTKNHNGDKRTYKTWTTESGTEVCEAFGRPLTIEEIQSLGDGKFHFFQRTTGVRIAKF